MSDKVFAFDSPSELVKRVTSLCFDARELFYRGSIGDTRALMNEAYNLSLNDKKVLKIYRKYAEELFDEVFWHKGISLDIPEGDSGFYY